MKRVIALVIETDDTDEVSDEELVRIIAESSESIDDCIKHIKIIILK